MNKVNSKKIIVNGEDNMKSITESTYPFPHEHLAKFWKPSDFCKKNRRWKNQLTEKKCLSLLENGKVSPHTVIVSGHGSIDSHLTSIVSPIILIASPPTSIASLQIIIVSDNISIPSPFFIIV